MVVKEFYMTRSDGVNLFRTYSDLGYQIKQNETGDIYTDAVDVENAPYTYTEVETKTEEEATETDYLNALAELGVDTNEETNA